MKTITVTLSIAKQDEGALKKSLATYPNMKLRYGHSSGSKGFFFAMIEVPILELGLLFHLGSICQKRTDMMEQEKRLKIAI